MESNILGLLSKRSVMTFFSSGLDHYCHRVRIVLAEKGVQVDIINVDENNFPEELTQLNPYNGLPTLIDRDLCLYQPNIMMEYLDERFPHPPLLPVYPVMRAQCRQWVYRVERDWCGYVDTILADKEKPAQIAEAKKSLRDSLLSVAPIFDEKPYFMSDEYTLVDCCIAPIFWRLALLDINLPAKQAKPIFTYMDRLFNRGAFVASLSEQEQEMMK